MFPNFWLIHNKTPLIQAESNKSVQNGITRTLHTFTFVGTRKQKINLN